RRASARSRCGVAAYRNLSCALRDSSLPHTICDRAYFGNCSANGKSGFINELPPSTMIVCPVINDASSLQSSAHVFAMSAGVANRRIGAQPELAHSLTACCPSTGNCPKSVPVSEERGLTAFTVMPSRANATAKYRHILSNAALADPIPTHGCQPPVVAPAL